MDRPRTTARVIAWDGWTEEAPWLHVFRRRGRTVCRVEASDDGWHCTLYTSKRRMTWRDANLARVYRQVERYA